MTQKNIIVVYSSENKKGKKDATGAFIPEARGFQVVHNIPEEFTLGVDCNRPAVERRRLTFEHIFALGRNYPIEGLAFFGHGWPTGIQFGIDKKHLGEFVELLKHVQCAPHLPIVLYACLTAENKKRDRIIDNIGPATKNGFADRLAQSLGIAKIAGHVDAHKTAGHTTFNPYVVRFINDKDESRAAWLIEPKSEYWYKWCRDLKGTNLRYQFPFMNDLEIRLNLDHKIWKVK